MTPQIGSAESIHTPGPIMLGMFSDMGWGSTTCSFGLDNTSATVVAAGVTGTSALSVTVSTGSGCAWTASTASTFATITSGASGTGSGVVRITVAANTGASSRSSTATIAGITYTINQAGTGPATVPGAPTAVTAVAGNAQATVSFTAPASTGGATITSYTATASPGGATATGAGSPLTVTGLTNGTTYTFTVTATNSAGAGAASTASVAVTPVTVPGAPTSVGATAGNAQASVSFIAPASTGGAAITSYTATASPGGATAAGSSSPLTVTGLTNGTTYTFTVKATNSAGAGPASAASAAITPATVPGAPTAVSAVAGNAQATVSFTAPASTGGAAITGYTVTASPGGATASGASSPLTVTGLTNGTAYTFTVTATNSAGAGAASSASAAITPATVPGAPTSVSAVAGSAQAIVSFTAPASNGGATITSYTVTASPGGTTASGSSSPLTVTGLTNGIVYTFTVAATNSAGTGASSSASAAATPTIPTMSLDRTALTFSATTNGVGFTSTTTAQAVRLTQTGGGTVTWTATSNQPWLIVSPGSGVGSATLTIATQFTTGLAASQAGSVTLVFTGAGNTAGPIAVTLTTLANGTTLAPSGSFDTPLDGTTGVTGSIAVTGWAMDDVEVTGVRILRDPIAGEPAGALVLLGNAVLVDGARPDVQASFPNSPRNTRAGWGYLMLTNFLPGLGNGTFKLTAIADDADGHSTVLGTKTITCTNSTATAPTGALDTPAQGGTVSGNVVNFGWVLSPSPRRADPPSGGTVRVVIDGALISAVPSGWTNRADLTALFPAAQFPGIVNALGVASFDSTPLTNGVHTISWLVTDNLGTASGIGSRYFTVSNGSLVLDPLAASPLVSGLDALPVPGISIRGRRGFDLAAPLQHYATHDGPATIQAEELDRIELQLGPGPLTGYLRVGAALAPLPVGSALDVTGGAFTWMPGVGFVGTYDLLFVRWAEGQAVARQDVRVVLNPMRSNRVGPQVVIDTPGSGQSVGRTFVLAGWAADLDSTVDRGVDTVHVWAYPASGDDPIWIGAADYGGKRPDVAAVHGARYLETGYGITVQGLPPGTYDLAVFAYSTVRDGFVPAKTVHVTVK